MKKHPSGPYAILILGARTADECIAVSKMIWDAAIKAERQRVQKESLDKSLPIPAFLRKTTD